MKTALPYALPLVLALLALCIAPAHAQELITQDATPATRIAPLITAEDAELIVPGSEIIIGEYESAAPAECKHCRHHACRCIDDERRAGYPQRVAFWAVPSRNCRYGGYTVGGSTPFHRHGDAPCADEGTWGWDYFGGLFRRRVYNSWLHGRDSGKPFGSYKTEGPNHIKAIHKKREERKAEREGH